MFHRTGKEDLLQALAAATRSKKNVNRNFMNVIHKHGVTFRVEIDSVQTPIRFVRPKLHAKTLRWPILTMRAWLRALINECPQFLFAGEKSCESEKAKQTFRSFWEQYAKANPQHEFFTSGKPPEYSIPVMFHGDEGRGARKTPFLVQSWQPVVSHLGLSRTTVSGHLVIAWQSIIACMFEGTVLAACVHSCDKAFLYVTRLAQLHQLPHDDGGYDGHHK